MEARMPTLAGTVRTLAMTGGCVAALGGVAFATGAVPVHDGEITACYGKENGSLRAVEARADCRNSERALTWNEKGDPGPQGDKGLQGDKGDTGAQGAPGPIEGTPAGGALAGTFPHPSLAPGAVGAAAIAAALLDGATDAPTLRSLGTGANQAAAGNDPRLANARVPTGAAGGSLAGSYPSPSLAANSVGSNEVANGALRVADLANVVGPYTFASGQFYASSGCNSVGYLSMAAKVGDVVIWNAQDVSSSIFFPTTRVEVENRLPIRICNLSTSGISLPSISLEALVLQH
jgi:hypothetical protein